MQFFQPARTKLDKLLQQSPHIREDVADAKRMLAGPLLIRGSENTDDEFLAPLATTEPTLVASCSRGSNALNQCSGVHFKVLGEDVSGASIFIFAKPADAIAFAERLPMLQPHFTRDVEDTSSHVHLRGLSHQIIGSNVHVRFKYHCKDKADPNLAAVTTQQACDNFMASPLAQELHILNAVRETRTVSDKHPSRADGEGPRGVQVIVWAKISDAVCNEVLRCSTRRLNDIVAIGKEGSIRNGNFGCNRNAASVIAAMFIACGQDAASVAEASWSQFTPEYNQTTKELKLTIFFPSIPVAVLGREHAYDTQKDSLQLLKCEKRGMNRRLAGLIGAFALASELSTSADVASSTSTESHEVLARGRMRTETFSVPRHEL